MEKAAGDTKKRLEESCLQPIFHQYLTYTKELQVLVLEEKS